MFLDEPISILVTGGTGSFGKAFINKLVNDFTNIKRLVIFSRDELKQYLMKSQFKSDDKILRYFIGDVRDLDRLKLAMQDVNIVIHAAALKHVESGEYNPFEVVKTNVVGTQNVVDAIVGSRVEKAIFLSTDKAAYPINAMGMSKALMEKVALSKSLLKQNSTTVCVTRYGNVIGSRGSVIPFFKKLIKERSKYLPITDKKMTRFTITLKEAVDFVIHCLHILLTTHSCQSVVSQQFVLHQNLVIHHLLLVGISFSHHLVNFQ